MKKSSVIILAGGQNRRMGFKAKSFLKIGKESFIEAVLDKVSDYDDVIIVTNTPELYTNLGVKVVTDILPGNGPLGGIYTGLKYALYDKAIVFPCDMPFVSDKVLHYIDSLSTTYDGVVPLVDGFYQPLCSSYSKSCLELFEKSIIEGTTKIIDLYPKMNIYYVTKEEIEVFGDYDKMFLNINTPEEYDKYVRRL